jgi:hypothetical protein
MVIVLLEVVNSLRNMSLISFIFIHGGRGGLHMCPASPCTSCVSLYITTLILIILGFWKYFDDETLLSSGILSVILEYDCLYIAGHWKYFYKCTISVAGFW